MSDGMCDRLVGDLQGKFIIICNLQKNSKGKRSVRFESLGHKKVRIKPLR